MVIIEEVDHLLLLDLFEDHLFFNICLIHHNSNNNINLDHRQEEDRRMEEEEENNKSELNREFKNIIYFNKDSMVINEKTSVHPHRQHQ